MRKGHQHGVLEKRIDRSCVCVAVIAERRYLAHPQPAGMISSLRNLGHSVQVIDPEDEAFEAADAGWAKGIDVAVARGRSWNVLCLLEWLDRLGVSTINRRSAIATVHNKAEMTAALAAANVPTPRTWLGAPGQVARKLKKQDFPVIVKPVFGDNCRGLEVVEDREKLETMNWPEPLAIVQSFFPNHETDLKLYCIGREVWAVRKPSPLLAPTDCCSRDKLPGLVPMLPAWRSLAERCGRVFGLELFGVDCIETAEGPLVIEVNEFPNYSAVPGADEKLSYYVVASARQERES